MICKIDEHPSFEESTQDYTGSIPSSVFFTFMNHSKYINDLGIDIIFNGSVKLADKEVSNCAICDYCIFPNNKIIEVLIRYIQDFNSRFGKEITKIFFVNKNGKITNAKINIGV